MFATLADPAEFLSPYGLRSLSRHHRDHPFSLDLDGQTLTVGYESAESTGYLFGGNSNWRGPVWLPVNYLVAGAFEQYAAFFGPDFTIEYPTGSGHQATPDAIADDLWRRLISLFVPGPDGRRPCFGGVERFQTDPRWSSSLLFHEYFHGDNGAGLGATHQTGWSALVAPIIIRRHHERESTADVVHRLLTGPPPA
jgi:hypothetical protein